MIKNSADHEHWRLNKTIDASHIITALVVMASIFWWVNSVERRVDKNSQAIHHLIEAQKQERNRVDGLLVEIKTDLRSINNKLDRFIERQAVRN